MNSNEKKNDSNFTYDMQDAYYYDDATGSFKKRTDEKKPDAAGEGQHGSGNGGGAAFLSLLAAIAGVCATASPLGLLLDICAILLAVYALVRRQHRKTAAAGILISVFSVAASFLLFPPFEGTGFLSGYLSSATDDMATENMASEETPRAEALADTGSDALSPEELESQETEQRNAAITIREYPLSNNLLLICENENLTDVNLRFQVIYYDTDGQMLSIEERWRSSCPAGGRSAVTIPAPADQDNKPVPYDHYELTMESEEIDPDYDCINYGSSLDIVSNVGVDGNILVSVTNSSERTFSGIELACIYYRDGTPVGMATQYLDGLSDQAAVKFFTPYDYSTDTPESITFDNHEILVLRTDYSME